VLVAYLSLFRCVWNCDLVFFKGDLSWKLYKILVENWELRRILSRKETLGVESMKKGMAGSFPRASFFKEAFGAASKRCCFGGVPIEATAARKERAGNQGWKQMEPV
jgi:hypothetical protein